MTTRTSIVEIKLHPANANVEFIERMCGVVLTHLELESVEIASGQHSLKFLTQRDMGVIMDDFEDNGFEMDEFLDFSMRYKP